MSSKVDVRKIATIYSRQVVWLTVATLVLVVFIFILEIVFPFLFQALLIKQGLVVAELPKRLGVVGTQSTKALVFSIILVSFFKNLLQGLAQFLGGYLVHYFRDYQRKKIVGWLLKSKVASSAKYISIFGEVVNNASASLLAFQGAVVQLVLSSSFLLSLFIMSRVTTAIAVGLMFFASLPLSRVMRKIGQHGNSISREWEKINKTLVLILKNMFFIRVSGISSQVKATALQGLRGYLVLHTKYHLLGAVSTYLPQFLGVLVILIVSWFGTERNLIQKALVVPYLYIFFRFSQTVSAFLKSYSNYAFYKTHSKQLILWGQEMERVVNREGNESSVDGELSLDAHSSLGWSLKEVSFKYESADANIFSNLTVDIPAAAVTVIIGSSGRGKSTLLSLLVGEQKPQRGSISYEIRLAGGAFSKPVYLVKDQINKYIGYVGPENLFIAGTIRENICFGSFSVPTEEQIVKVLKVANCDFILNNMDRLNEKVGDFGEGLSSGQRQRLSLARALLRSPKILLLDEATSNLDSKSQEIFINSVSNLKGNMTVLIITHRDELLKLADKVIDLDQFG